MSKLNDKVENILKNARLIEYREVLGTKTNFGEKSIPDHAFPLFYNSINPHLKTIWLTVSEPYPWATKTIALWNARPQVYYGDGLPLSDLIKNRDILIAETITTDEEIVNAIVGKRIPEIYHDRQFWDSSGNLWSQLKNRFYQMKGGEER